MRLAQAFKSTRRGEVAMTFEPRRADVSIQKMKKIRDHRLQIAEMELVSAQKKCDDSRLSFRQSVSKVRQAKIDCAEYWAQSIKSFYNCVINSKQFVACKCHHQNLKLEISTFRHAAREALKVAKADRLQLRLAKISLQEQRLRVEKLQMFKEISQSYGECNLA